MRRTLTCSGQPAADKPIDKQTKRAHAGTEKKSRSERGTHPGTDAANSCAWAKQSAGRESTRGQAKKSGITFRFATLVGGLLKGTLAKA